MPEVVIIGADGKEHVFPDGFDPKKAAAIVRGGGAPAESGGGVLETAKDLGIGALKGAGRTIADVVSTAAHSRAIPGLTPESLPSAVVEQFTPEYTNTAQRVGGAAETVAELAMPALKAAKAVPSASRASRAIQAVTTAAKDAPVNIEGPGQVALRIQQLADRGGTMPRMVGKLLQRVTDPEKAPMAFEEGRDFYSNVSRLSADEYNRLTGPVKHEIGNLRATLHDALTGAADTVGAGKQYAGAVKEYAQAAKLTHYKDALLKFLIQKAAPAAGAGGALGAAYQMFGK